MNDNGNKPTPDWGCVGVVIAAVITAVGTIIAAIISLNLIGLPEQFQVEVTKIVHEEVEVTRLVDKFIEVTRIIPQEVVVTELVLQEVEVTREVTRVVEVGEIENGPTETNPPATATPRPTLPPNEIVTLNFQKDTSVNNVTLGIDSFEITPANTLIMNWWVWNENSENCYFGVLSSPSITSEQGRQYESIDNSAESGNLRGSVRTEFTTEFLLPEKTSLVNVIIGPTDLPLIYSCRFSMEPFVVSLPFEIGK